MSETDAIVTWLLAGAKASNRACFEEPLGPRTADSPVEICKLQPLFQPSQPLARFQQGLFLFTEGEPHQVSTVSGIPKEAGARHGRNADLADQKLGEFHVIGKSEWRNV